MVLSKVIRIENGEVSISPDDLRPLLSYPGVRDKAVTSLIADARIARTRQRQAWYQRPEFRNHMTDVLRHLIEYEAEATAIHSYRVYYPPGPFQVPRYASELRNSWGDELTAENIRRRFEAPSAGEKYRTIDPQAAVRSLVIDRQQRQLRPPQPRRTAQSRR